MFDDLIEKKRKEKFRFRCISCNKPLEKNYWCPDCNPREYKKNDRDNAKSPKS
jgi:lipopolysaccharide biosynthesis regulator YciM